eukprot:1160884-Pelagomonas_calceolata.AAC.12
MGFTKSGMSSTHAIFKCTHPQTAPYLPSTHHHDAQSFDMFAFMIMMRSDPTEALGGRAREGLYGRPGAWPTTVQIPISSVPG